MKWHDMTDTPPEDKLCFFRDDQAGQEFTDYGNTNTPYTYWRLLTEVEVKQFKKPIHE